jgi:hypothetical protein
VVVDTPHWGAAAASPAGATAADSCSSQQEHASAISDGMSRMRSERLLPGTAALSFSVERLTPVHPRLAGTVGRGVRKSDEPLGRACASSCARKMRQPAF